MPDLDLTSAVDAAVASLTIEHDSWCCSMGCAGGHVGRAQIYRCAGGEDDCTCLRREVLHHVREAVKAASPLIREALAEEIERFADERLSDADEDFRAGHYAAAAILRGDV